MSSAFRVRVTGNVRSLSMPLARRTIHERRILPGGDSYALSFEAIHGFKSLYIPFCSGLSSRRTWSAMVQRDSGNGILDSDARNGTLDSDTMSGILSLDARCENFDSDGKNVIFSGNGVCDSESRNGMLYSNAKDEILGSDAQNMFRDSDSGSAILDSDARNRISRKFDHPPWPEWKLFLNHLKTFGLANMETAKVEVNDSALLKQAIVKFSRDHESILKRLPLTDLSILLKHEFPQNDERTNAARKRLQIYVQMKENNVLPSDHNHVVSAKLKDVMRLIYKAVVGFRVYFVDGTNSNTKRALLQLLKALVSLSGGPTHGISPSHRKQVEMIERDKETENIGDQYYCGPSGCEGIEWTCSGCSCLNMHGKESCLQCKEPRLLPVQDQECVGKNTFEKESLCLGESTEPRKFHSIKERVDARKARLERERIQKEVARAASSPLIATSSHLPVVVKGLKKADIDTSVAPAARNFQALDSIVESVDSDEDLATSQYNGKRASRSAKKRF